MIEMRLTQDEAKLIHRIRLAPPFSTIKAEKKPTEQQPTGEIWRITTEESLLARDIAIAAVDLTT